ncbi:MAG: SurA N-terminal domain-containing protein [Patulibacter sp.]|nr:SurA N-terminal domain-containing protein [Patulibacter sp.]
MPRTPSRRTAVRLVLALAATATLAACGGDPADDVPDDAVAVVNGAPISQATFDRWYEITMREASFAGSPLSDAEISDRVMSTLIRARWVRGEAEELGIEVPKSELEEEWKRTTELEYAGGKTFEEYLEETGLTEAELRYRIATGKYTIFLTRWSQAEAGGADAPDVDEKMLAYNRDYTARWKALTVCAEDHLIADCSNYDGGDVGLADEAADSPAQ